MPVDVPPPVVELIDYAYSSNGMFYHGTISNLDGKPKSTWTVSVGDKKKTFDEPIDPSTFAYLVNGILNFPIFARSFVSDPNTKMDFDHYQAIGFIVSQGGQNQIKSYLIAPTESDPDYKDWIAKLQVPVVKDVDSFAK